MKRTSLSAFGVALVIVAALGGCGSATRTVVVKPEPPTTQTSAQPTADWTESQKTQYVAACMRKTGPQNPDSQQEGEKRSFCDCYASAEAASGHQFSEALVSLEEGSNYSERC
jgi:hypothetical protein